MVLCHTIGPWLVQAISHTPFLRFERLQSNQTSLLAGTLPNLNSKSRENVRRIMSVNQMLKKRVSDWTDEYSQSPVLKRTRCRIHIDRDPPVPTEDTQSSNMASMETSTKVKQEFGTPLTDGGNSRASIPY